MSTTIDQRVVEMRFDNQQFEKNCSTTLSTLEKLKQKLNLTGASKGLESVGSAAKKVDMSGLNKSIETVNAKFSAMQVIGTTALVNITNSAMAAGKKMISALTIDPVKTGFQEYETQINSTQTILANTASKGSTIEDVNKALEELNTYADKTIYNFTEMTRNIGTFTAAGIDLDTSVNAIQGIANLAAVSGSTSQQASTAMYQLSQALAAGTVKLMDWNSVVNAGMGGEMFQNALKETSKLLGTGAEEAIKATGSFRESLREGWLTSEVLTETLKKFTTSGANEYIAEYTGLSREAVEAEVEKAKATGDSATAMDRAAESIAKMSGKSKDEIKTALEFAQTAEDAATKVKTFTQLWDVMKESAQSGWSQTWKIIIGDFEQAKALLTPLADFATGVINKMSNARNFIVEGVMDFAAPWTTLTKKLGKVQEVANTVTKVTDKLEYFQKVVNDVWRGDYKNSDTGRFELLEKAGYDHRVVQDLVNKGYQYKITVEDIEASHKKFGLTMETTTEETKAVTDALAGLDEETLRNAGLTEDEIRLYNDLVKGAEKYGMSVDELAKKMSETSGRDLLIESLKNIGNVFVNTFKAISNAWGEIFDPVSIVNIYMALEAFRDWTKTLSLVDSETGELNETGQNIQRTFKGIFAIVDILTTILGGGLKIAFKIASSVLGYFGLNILDVTAAIGDVIVKIRDWFDGLFDVSGVLDVIIPPIKRFVEIVRELFAAFKASDAYQNFVSGIKSVFTNMSLIIKKAGGIKGVLSDFFSNLFGPITKLSGVSGFIKKIASAFKMLTDVTKGADPIAFFEAIHSAFSELKNISLKEIGVYIWDGLILGLFNGAKKIVTTIVTVGQNLINKFCELLGIHSPSTVFMAIGGFIIAGLIAGIKEGLISVPESLQGIVDKCIAIFQAVDWGTIMAFGVSIGGLMFIKKVGDVLENFSAPFAGLGEILENVAGLVQSFGKVTKAAAFNIRMKGIKQLAIAIAIIAGSIIALVHFGGNDYGKMWNAVGMIVVLAAVLAGLSIAMNKLSDSSVDIEKGKFKLSGLKSGLMAMAAAVAIIAGVTYLLGGMDEKSAQAGFIRLGLIMAGILGFVKICQVVTKGDISANIGKIGSLMIKLGIAMALMVGVCKLIDTLEPREMIKAGAFALAFGIFVVAITSVAKSAGNNVGKVGGMMVKMAIAMALMVGVCKLIDTLKPAEAIKAGIFALAFVGFVKALVKITTIGKKQQIAKLGGLLLSISTSMLLMVGVCKLVGKLTVEDMIKGAAFAAGFAVFVWALVSITKIGSDKQIAKVSGTILAISVAVGILAAVCMLLSLLKIEDLAKGVIAVGILGSVMALMLYSLKDVNATKELSSSLTTMVIAIALMAVAVAGLSFIEPKKLAGAVAAMSILMGMFALITYSTKHVQKAMGTLIIMTVAIAALAGVLWAMSELDVQNSLTNAAALSLLMLAMSGVMKILTKLETKVWSSIKTAIALTMFAVPMAAFAWVLSKMNGVENAMTNVVAISTLMLAMGGLMTIFSKLVDPKAFGYALLGVVALAAMVGPMAAFIAMLAWMQNIENATTNAAAITKLMWSMTGLLAVLTVIGAIVIATGGVAAGAIAIGVVALAAMVGPMAAFIAMLAWMQNIENAESNAKLLIGLMTVMTGLLTQLAIIAPFAALGVISLGALTILMGAIGALVVAIGGLNELTDGGLEKLIDSGIPLLIKLAEGIGTMVGKFIGCIAEGIADSLVKVGDDIVDLMLRLNIASQLAKGIDASSFDGVKELLGVLGDIGLTMVGTTFADIFTLGGTSMEKFEKDGVAFFGALSAISDEMIDFSLPENFSADSVKTLLSAISMVGVSTVGTTWSDIFTLGGTSMEKFEADGKAFFGAIKAISEEMTGFKFPENFSMEGLTTLLDALKTVSSRMLGNSWKEAFTLGEGTTMEQFEADGKAFFGAIKAISQEMTGFKFPENFSIEGLTTLLDVLKTVGTSMMGTSWSEFFTLGEGTTMEQFETDAKAFFSAIKNITPEMTGFKFPEEFSVDGLIKLLDTLKTVGTAMMGTSWSDFFTLGEGNSMEQFETYGTGLFQAIKAISTEATGVTTESFSVGITAIEKIKEIFASLKGIDYSGVEEFTGIGTGGFGADGPMHDIGVAIKDFGTQVSGIDVAVITTAVTAANKIRTIIASLVDLDTSGIENFKAKAIGTAIKDYSTQVADIDPAVVSSSISSANRLRTFIASLVDLDSSGVGNFKIGSIGTTLQSYAESVAGMDVGVVSSSISVANRLKNFITSLVGIDSSGVTEYKNAINTLGTVSLDSFVKAFSVSLPNLSAMGSDLINSLVRGIQSKQGVVNNAGHNIVDVLLKGMNSRKSTIVSFVNKLLNDMTNAIKSKISVFNTAGVLLISNFVNGISKHKNAVQTSIISQLSSALTSINGYYNSFYSAGSYLVDGLAAGISANSYKAEAKAAAMASAAYEAAKKALDINSPSKIFRSLGYSVPEGFAMGIDRLSGLASNSATYMADTTIETVSNSVSRIADLINSDMDMQPTIRPVVDLSNVRAGANSIGSMLGFGTSVGVMANVSAINSMMNQRNQNGGNDDVVSAINKLRSDLGNVRGNTYNVNGITYDDGSAVSDAIGALTRAAKLERRI